MDSDLEMQYLQQLENLQNVNQQLETTNLQLQDQRDQLVKAARKAVCRSGLNREIYDQLEAAIDRVEKGN